MLAAILDGRNNIQESESSMSDADHRTLEERATQIVVALTAEVDKNCPGLDCTIRNEIFTTALDHCYKACQDLQPTKNPDLAVAKPATASLRAVFNINKDVADVGIRFGQNGEIIDQHAVTASAESPDGLRVAQALDENIFGVMTKMNYEIKQYGGVKV